MNNDDILVSIVMPCYNDELFVSDAISSVLKQTHRNIELLIVDDNSSDKTLEIVRSFKDKRIRLFCNERNRGAAFSRNVALSKASGKYIAFLDGDDFWAENKIENQLLFMLKHNYRFTYTNYFEVDESNNERLSLITGPKKISHRKMMKGSFVGCLTVMYERALFPDLSIPEGIVKRNDYALWLRLSERASCYLFASNLCFYRKRKSGSISSGKKKNLFKHHIRLFQLLYKKSYFSAFILSLRNVFYYFVKKILYVHKLKTKKE